MKNKLLLIIIDGQPWRNARRLMGNLEGWVDRGCAKLFKMQAALPSTSASCYATIHTGLPPQVHKIFSNEERFKIAHPDIFSECHKAGLITGAVTHSYFSDFFHRYPFDPIEDIELDDCDGPITHARFHTMTGMASYNHATPSDVDLFASLTRFVEKKQIDYGILHSCTLDSIGHVYGHDSIEMDKACFYLDAQLAPYIDRWLESGYEIIVTADHGQTDRGHHGGNDPEMRDVALYYFGSGSAKKILESEMILDQVQLAPTILSRLSVEIPDTMLGNVFIESD